MREDNVIDIAMKIRQIGAFMFVLVALLTIAHRVDATQSGSWSPLNNPLCSTGQPCLTLTTPLLLTDGTVIMHEVVDCGGVTGGGSRWFRLTPDITGSYVNGTWSEIASLPTGYAPHDLASQVLPDGRVIINGGEDNGCSIEVWTNLGAIYDPVSDVWTPVPPPNGWTMIGDAPSIVLADGRYMLGNGTTNQQAILNAATLTWTPTGSNKADLNDEEGWTLLPDGSVLTIDTNNTADQTHAEKYLPTTGGWISAGSTVVQLDGLHPGQSVCGVNFACEIGPQLLLPNGTVFVAGGTANTAIYKPAGKINMPGMWTPGPTFPIIAGQQFVAADAPGAVLTDGNALIAVSPYFAPPTHFFEYDGTTLTQVAEPPTAPNQWTDTYFMLALPTGEVLLASSLSTDIEIYQSVGTFNQAWRPSIKKAPSTLVHGQTYQVSGKMFNGVSSGGAFGDEYQGATNYPLVRITNLATGHVFYCRTFNNTSVQANFTVPSGIETGNSRIEVVTNGIPSVPQAVSVM
jgi:hypothetical protein